MKVAQTRLHLREDRPNVELCRDPVQYRSVSWRHLGEGLKYVKSVLGENLNTTKLSIIPSFSLLGGGSQNLVHDIGNSNFKKYSYVEQFDFTPYN